MEPGRFDALTRTFATHTSRRTALCGLLGGGLTASLLGTGTQHALAQAPRRRCRRRGSSCASSRLRRRCGAARTQA